jgi:rubrerythrin
LRPVIANVSVEFDIKCIGTVSRVTQDGRSAFPKNRRPFVQKEDTMSNCEQCANYPEQLEDSILDEICDAGFYAQIANEAPTEELREIIISIVGDEYGHARLQASLLGICPPPIACPPACPPATGNFETDVETAIAGELGAIRRYAELASCAPTLQIRYLLTSILGDEYAHARIWTAMLLAPSMCEDPAK